jgi:hypothetical protein
MAVVNDYKCPKHGYFEARKPKCPMKDCHEKVMVVFLQAPNLISAKTTFTDKSTKQLAIEFDMSDIKTTREGENQSGYLTRKNKFKEKDYEQAEKYATRKKGVNKDQLKPMIEPEIKEPRPGDAAKWGGGFQGINLQAVLAGKFAQPINGEPVGLTPSQAGIKTGPVIDPRATMRDPDNLQIKK